LKNSISNGFKLFKKRIIVKLSNRQASNEYANIQAELSKTGAKLTHSTWCHHVRRDYCSRWSYTRVWWRINRFASPMTKPHPRP